MPLNSKHFVCRSCSDWGKSMQTCIVLDTGPETDARGQTAVTRKQAAKWQDPCSSRTGHEKSISRDPNSQAHCLCSSATYTPPSITSIITGQWHAIAGWSVSLWQPTSQLSLLLQNCKNSLSPSTLTLQRVQHCKSTSHRCNFREAARTASLSRLQFHFSWEMMQPPWLYHQKDMRQHFVDCLKSRVFAFFQQQKRRQREKVQMSNRTFSYKYAKSSLFKYYVNYTNYLHVYIPVYNPRVHTSYWSSTLPNCLSPVVLWKTNSIGYAICPL